MPTTREIVLASRPRSSQYKNARPPDGYNHWYDARNVNLMGNGNLFSGSSILTWYDAGPEQIHLTASFNAPRLEVSSSFMFGESSVDFLGSTDCYFTGTMSTRSIPTATLMIICKAPFAGDIKYFFDGSFSNQRFAIAQHTTANRAFVHRGATGGSATGAGRNNLLNYIVAYCSGTTSKINFNSIEIPVISIGTDASLSGLRVGCAVDFTSHLTGSISEILIYYNQDKYDEVVRYAQRRCSGTIGLGLL